MTTYLSYPAATPSGPAPDYTPQDIELARLDSTSPSILSAPPPYGEVTSSSFHPTVHLQIETPGKPWFCLPSPPRPDPIPIFTLSSSDSDASAASTSTTTTTPTFISLRPERSSGSCYLTSPSNTPNDPSTVSPLATTTYRFGPNRPARMRLFSPHAAPMSTAALHTLLLSKDKIESTSDHARRPETPLSEEEQHEPLEPWDSFPLTSPALLTRTLAFRTRLGTFEWRYASRRERHALSQARGGQDVSSLLVLERVVRVATAQNNNQNSNSPSVTKNGEEQIRTPVAHFVRGRGTRTEGSGASSAGNGGRLDVDLRMWEHHHRHDDGDDGDGGDGQADKVEREMVVVLVVATCLVMLKREVDRRRAQKFAIIAMAVS